MGMGAFSAGNIGNTLSAGGMAVQGLSSVGAGFANAGAQSAQGTYQAAMYKINAGLAGMQADDAINRGNLAAGREIGKTRQIQGAQRAAGASQGVDVNSGSVLHAESDAAGIGALDALTIKNNAYRQAFGYQAQEIQSNSAAEFAKEAGSNSAMGSILTGGMGFLSSGLKGAGYLKGVGGGGGQGYDSRGWYLT